MHHTTHPLSTKTGHLVDGGQIIAYIVAKTHGLSSEENIIDGIVIVEKLAAKQVTKVLFADKHWGDNIP